MRAWADWLDPLPDAAAMRAADAWAAGPGAMASIELMERAGSGLAELVTRTAPHGRVLVVCAMGNNGGDGLVAARRLRDAGREVDVREVGNPTRRAHDAQVNLDRLPGAAPAAWVGDAVDGAAVIVDALLGTGAQGAPRPELAAVIEAMNRSGLPVVCADVPSGVDGSTGEVTGVAVRATATASFHRATPGLWIGPGKSLAGRVSVIDLGLPEAPGAAPTPIGLLTRRVLADLPRRGAQSTKHSSGVVGVVGGSAGLTGAPALAALAAQRTGAGYVTVVCPQSAQLGLSIRLLEAMPRGVAEKDGALCERSLEPALAALARIGAAVVGPGLGRAAGTQAFIRALVQRLDAPLVLDADGLNAHAGALERLRDRRAPTVLTPHAGELARLLEVGDETIAAQRLASVREAAERSGASVVLKGDDTLIALPDGRVTISPGGAPALATAGTGDVLAGVCGALLAQGVEPARAVGAAVLAHLHAGQLAAEPDGPNGVVASDVIARLPAALRDAPEMI